jgi:hypothetical protein
MYILEQNVSVCVDEYVSVLVCGYMHAYMHVCVFVRVCTYTTYAIIYNVRLQVIREYILLIYTCVHGQREEDSHRAA